MNRRYPQTGYTPRMLQLLDSVDYVEYPQFSGANLGYFCATCAHFRHKDQSPEGVCLMLEGTPVRSYGCCNAWKLGNTDTLSNGVSNG